MEIRWALAPFVASALLTALCALVVARRAPQPGAREYARLLVVETVWTIAYIGELSAATLETKLAWDDVQLVALAIGVLIVPEFLWAYSERLPQHVARWRILLAIPPLLAVGFVLTDPWHGRARPDARVLPATPFHSLVYSFSPPEWILVAEVLVVVAVALVALGRTAARQHREHRFQTSLVALALALPTGANMISMAGFRPYGDRDLAPALFGLAAVPLTYAIYRRRFFDLAPVARHVVFEQLPDPVLVLDSRFRILDANPSAHAAFGDGGPLLGRPVSELFELDLSGWVSAARKKSATVIRGDRIFEVRSEAFDARDHDTRGYALLFRDVTERERAAMASEERFRTLFDRSFQLMGVVDEDGIIVSVNRTALDYLGATEDEVVGRPFADARFWRGFPEMQQRVLEGIARAKRGGAVHFEVTYPDADRVVRHFDFSLKPISLDPCQILAEGRDITDHVRAEEERTALREQLHHSQRLDSIGRLAGGIAHDFNNLLTVILGQVELARFRVRDAATTESLDEIARAAESAASLTRQLLAFARKQTSEPTVLDANTVLVETSRMLERVIGEEVRLHLALDPGPAYVRIDRGGLEQVALNLAVNARDAMPEGGDLTISTEPVTVGRVFAEAHGGRPSDRGFLRIRVRDTGVGMPLDVKERLFEPFFTTKAPGEGTGLGLSTVYGVVTQAGGFVDVVSTPGEGASFDVYLPVSDALPEPPRRATPRPRGHERLALVEDQAAVRALASEQLSLLGYEVVAYESAEQALASLPDQLDSFALLVTDVVLGGMNGPALVEQLRKTRPDLPVLYMSGYTDDAVLARGVDDRTPFVHKPFTFDQLAQAVREAIDVG